eukprot:6284102-Prymnesium_polylepis.1
MSDTKDFETLDKDAGKVVVREYAEKMVVKDSREYAEKMAMKDSACAPAMPVTPSALILAPQAGAEFVERYRRIWSNPLCVSRELGHLGGARSCAV